MKKITIAFVVVGLLTIGVYLFARFALKTPGFKQAETADSSLQTMPKENFLDLRPRLINRLQQLVNKGSNGLYNLYISEVEPDILASEISLRHVSLQPDSAVLASLNKNEREQCNLFSFKSDSIHITGIGISDIFSKNTLDLKKVFINAPVISILQKSHSSKNDSLTLYQCLLGQLKSLSVKDIIVRNGTVINHSAKSSKPVSFGNFYANLSELLIDSSTQNDKDRFLFAKQATLSLKNYSWEDKDGFYDYAIDKLTITTADRMIRISDFKLHPKFSKESFAKKAGSAKERYDLHIASLVLKNVNWWNLANNESLIAEEATVNSGDLDIYLDRSLPQKISRVGNYPHQLLMKVPMKIYIGRVNVENVSFDYAEFNPLSAKQGGLSIKNMKGTIANLTNMPSVIKTKPLTVVRASGSFMGLSNANLMLQLNMQDYKNGSFKASLNVKGFEGKLINPLAEPIGMFSIRKGKLKELQSSVSGNNNSASGTIVFQYEDLKVAALEKDAGKPKGLDKKDVTSFLANTFLVKKQNPAADSAPRKETGNFDRDPYSSFFNLIWKTTFVGILRTTGLPEKLAYKK